jgi:hypothetical protein
MMKKQLYSLACFDRWRCDCKFIEGDSDLTFDFCDGADPFLMFGTVFEESEEQIGASGEAVDVEGGVLVKSGSLSHVL